MVIKMGKQRKNFIQRAILSANNHGMLNFMSDKSNISLVYWAQLGKRLNLKNPRTLNEKMQWIKLYDRKSEYTQMVDKYEVRDYVAKKIGEDYLIPLIGVWDNGSEIKPDALPEQFVLKCNHDSGSVRICKDKSTFDFDEAVSYLDKRMKRRGDSYGREWPYKNIKPRIIAEKFMIDGKTSDLRDYKIHCFNGEPKVILVCSERHITGLKEDWFSTNWEHLPVCRPTHPNSGNQIEKPEQLEEMLKLARILADGLSFSRIDFYVVNGKIYFGEITFFPTSGYTAFEPDEYDTIFGDWVKLPDKKTD